MSFMDKIVSGVVDTPTKMTVYGDAGVGKSTFASSRPNALVLDTEDSTKRLNCKRIPIHNWADLCSPVMELGREKTKFKTLVIDSIDQAERHLFEYMCQRDGKDSIESYGFGKGYVKAAESFGKFLAGLDQVVRNGMNVILVCHSTIKKVSPPDQTDSFDRYELRLIKHIGPLVLEWSDVLGFLTFDQQIITAANGQKKAKGGKRRLMHTQRSAAFDAKSRLDLPEVIAVDDQETVDETFSFLNVREEETA